MIVAVARPQRPYVDLSDLTTKEILRRGWEDVDGDEQYVIQFAVNLTAAEVEAIQRRLKTGSQVEETLQARAVDAYQDLGKVDELVLPITNAQILTVLKLFARVLRALIRTQFRRFDSTD